VRFLCTQPEKGRESIRLRWQDHSTKESSVGCILEAVNPFS
jgi:hypothetical protein